MYYSRFRTSLCEIILVGDEEGLACLQMVINEGKQPFVIDDQWIRHDRFFQEAREQILGYFEGRQRAFDLALNPGGTAFQQKVWKVLLGIPYGEVRTYKDIAIAVGNPNAARAVGMAASRNPIPLIIPCHRVIGSNGKLTGFSCGLSLKQALLGLEQAGKGSLPA